MPSVGIGRFANRKKTAPSQDGAAAASASERPDNPDGPSAARNGGGAPAPPAVPLPPGHDVPGGEHAADTFAPFAACDRPDSSGPGGFAADFGGMFDGHGQFGAGYVGEPPEVANPFIIDRVGAGGDAMFNLDGAMGELRGGGGKIV